MDSQLAKQMEFTLYMLLRLEEAEQLGDAQQAILDLIQGLFAPHNVGICLVHQSKGNTHLTSPMLKGFDNLPDMEKEGCFMDLYDQFLLFCSGANAVRILEEEDLAKMAVYKEKKMVEGRLIMASAVWQREPVGFLFMTGKGGGFCEEERNLLLSLLPHFALRLYTLLKIRDFNGRYVLGSYMERFDLSRREAQVARLLCQGRKAAQICSELYISNSTFKKHVGSILQKTGTANSSQLVQLLTKDM